MFNNDQKEKYPFALISSNFTFDEWKNREEGFQCQDTSQTNQYVLLCEDKWKGVFDDLDMHKSGAEQAELTLNIVLILIASQLALILGLVFYILRNHGSGNEKTKNFITQAEFDLENEQCHVPIIVRRNESME